jgi:hypothetical protein
MDQVSEEMFTRGIQKFLDTQKHKDYPAVIPEPAPHRYLLYRDSAG